MSSPPADSLRALVEAVDRGDVAAIVDAAGRLTEGLRQTTTARARRDAAIRQMAARHFAGLSIRGTAARIARLGREYQARGRHRAVGAPADELRQLLREALDTGVPFPGSRQIFRVLRVPSAAPSNGTPDQRS
jgi:hypothetical protein